MSNPDYSNVTATSGRNLARNNPRQVKAAETVITVTNLLTSQFKAIKSALPRHMTPERMCRVALNTIRRTPELLECAPETMVAAIVEASSLGLEIDSRGQAYLVPFRNKNTGRREVQLIPGYKGLADLAYRSGRVDSIFAEVVCENDKFRFSLGLNPTLEHTPSLEDRGKLIAVYAVARMKESAPQFVVMGKGDIDKIKKASKASGGPWRDWEAEMWKKTAIRRLCKMLPLSPEMQRAVSLDEASEAGIVQGLGENILEIPVQVEDVVREATGVEEAPAEVEAPTEAVKASPEQHTEPEAAPKQAVEDAPHQQPEQAALSATPTPEAAPAPQAPQEMPTFQCPRPNKDGSTCIVDETVCMNCKDRPGCPEWAGDY